MRLYYSVSDPYPAYRVDISELFGIEMAALGVSVEWFMMGEPPAGHGAGPLLYGNRQKVNLPPATPAGPWRRLLSWGADAAGVIRAAWRVDVDAVQCRDKFFVSLVAALACRLSGKPFFYWCSYPFPEHHVQAGVQQGGMRGLLQRLKGQLEFGLLYRVIMPLARHVFVQSEQMRDDIAGYGLPADRMTPVPMGVPLRLLQWAAGQQRSEVVSGRVVYIGTLGAVRRLEMLVRSFALVHARQPQTTMLIVGDGDFPHERQALEALVQSLGLGGCVRFTGFVPIEQAWSFAASAAVCVSPFFPTQVLRSASPTKLVEYLALGRPVVCNDHPEQSAIIAACGAGRCVPWDEHAFADAMVALLQEPVKAEFAASAGPGWVAAHRTYPQIARTVFERYLALVPQRP